MKEGVIIGLVALAFFVFGVALGVFVGLRVASAAEEVSGIVTVIDGDTLDVDGIRVRIWGIDSPEVATEAGREAQAWARAEWTGKRVTCAVRGPKSYGRTVAQCFRRVDGALSDLAFELVRAGHAVDVPRFSGGYYK